MRHISGWYIYLVIFAYWCYAMILHMLPYIAITLMILITIITPHIVIAITLLRHYGYAAIIDAITLIAILILHITAQMAMAQRRSPPLSAIYFSSWCCHAARYIRHSYVFLRHILMIAIITLLLITRYLPLLLFTIIAITLMPHAFRFHTLITLMLMAAIADADTPLMPLPPYATQ